MKGPLNQHTAQSSCLDTSLYSTPSAMTPQPPSPSRAEPQSILLLFCESRMIIICIKFDCLNRSGLIGTNTQKCALPVISDSLANAFCKIALDFNNRLLVLEHCAHFISNCQSSPLSLAAPGALGSEILVGGLAPSGKGILVVSWVLAHLSSNPSRGAPGPAVAGWSESLKSRLGDSSPSPLLHEHLHFRPHLFSLSPLLLAPRSPLIKFCLSSGTFHVFEGLIVGPLLASLLSSLPL